MTYLSVWTHLHKGGPIAAAFAFQTSSAQAATIQNQDSRANRSGQNRMPEGAMSEARSDTGHEILNPFGVRIRVSKIVLRTLNMRGYLQRDQEFDTGLKQIRPKSIGFFKYLEHATYHRELSASVGPDFSGPCVVICSYLECQRVPSDIDHTPLPGRNYLKDQETAAIIRELKAKRRCA